MSRQVSGASATCLPMRSSRLSLPSADERHHQRGRELLADRPGLIDRLRTRRNAELDVREPIALGLDDLPVAHDGEREAGDLLALHLGRDEGVDLRAGRRRRQHGEEDQGSWVRHRGGL